MHVIWLSIVSEISSEWNDLHAWNSCSHVLPILDYCCLNWAFRPSQSTAMGLSDSYHNLTSPTNVRQNHWTLTPFWSAWLSTQSFVLRSWASASSLGLPVNSGLKCDQFICGNRHGCAGGTIGCYGGVGGTTGGGCGACGPHSAIFLYFWWGESIFYFIFHYPRYYYILVFPTWYWQ